MPTKNAKKYKPRKYKPKYRRNRMRPKRVNEYGKPLSGAFNPISTPLPERFKQTLRYIEYKSLDIPAFGNCTRFTVCLNDLYHPTVATNGVAEVGHQYRGWDQLIAFYSRATSVGCKVLIDAVNTGTDPIIMGYVITKLDNIATSGAHIMEAYNNIQYKQVGKSSSSDDKYRAIVKFSPKRYFGLKDILNNTAYSSTDAVGPTEKAYLHFFISRPYSGTNDPSAIKLTLTMQNIVVFQTPTSVIASAV